MYGDNAERAYKKLNLAIKQNGGVECSEYQELFIPDEWVPQGQIAEDYKFLRKICDRCPVKDLCADYAIESKQQHGLWAGMTSKQLLKKYRERYGNVTDFADSGLDPEVAQIRDTEGQAEEHWGESDLGPLYLSPSDGPDWGQGIQDEVLAGWEDWDSDSLVA